MAGLVFPGKEQLVVCKAVINNLVGTLCSLSFLHLLSLGNFYKCCSWIKHKFHSLIKIAKLSFRPFSWGSPTGMGVAGWVFTGCVWCLPIPSCQVYVFLGRSLYLLSASQRGRDTEELSFTEHYSGPGWDDLTASLLSPFYRWGNQVTESPYSSAHPANHRCVYAWLPFPTR